MESKLVKLPLRAKLGRVIRTHKILTKEEGLQVPTTEDMIEEHLLNKIKYYDSENYDIVCKYILYKERDINKVKLLLGNELQLAQMMDDTLEVLRQDDFVPPWSIDFQGEQLSVCVDGKLVLPNRCLRYLQHQVRSMEPALADGILEFLHAQNPIYVCDVLQYPELLETAIVEAKNALLNKLKSTGEAHPYHVESEERTDWWWTRWFGIGASHPDPAQEGQATAGDVNGSEADTFGACVLTQVAGLFPKDADAIVAMMSQLPSSQRLQLVQDPVYLRAKAEQCHGLLYDNALL